MKPTTEQIIDWGRTALNETGALIPAEWNMELLEAICSAAYEAGRKDEREWQGLTDEEVIKLGRLDKDSDYFGLWYDFAQAIEAKLKEKNT